MHIVQRQCCLVRIVMVLLISIDIVLSSAESTSYTLSCHPPHNKPVKLGSLIIPLLQVVGGEASPVGAG